jgi:single-stranded DNA-specific DHH superfamily exonuclease
MEDVIRKIKESVKKASNPLFIFDNDPDGLCSFLILYRKFQKGEFKCATSAPHDMEFYERAIELNSPDLLIFLDRPFLAQSFVDNCEIPIIWIDHHPQIFIKKVLYLNSRNYGSKAPASFLSYKIARQDKFISALGCVADWYVPRFIEEIRKKHPEMLGNAKKPGEILFKTRFGELVRLLSFNLVGEEKEMERSLKILINLKDFSSILDCGKETEYLCEKYRKINSKYQKLLEKAKQNISEDVLILFTYSSKTSLSGELSDELMFNNPEKAVIIARKYKQDYKMSIRSMKFNVQEAATNAMKGLRGVCGGHEHACGANIYYKDFEKFVNDFRQNILKR